MQKKLACYDIALKCMYSYFFCHGSLLDGFQVKHAGHEQNTEQCSLLVPDPVEGVNLFLFYFFKWPYYCQFEPWFLVLKGSSV